MVGFEDIEAKVTDEFGGIVRYGWCVGERIQEVIEVTQVVLKRK